MNIKKTPPLTQKQILITWWPLALSWLLMSIEGPANSAIAARLANPEINLAAWGGIVLPLALIIEAPVIMLLATSTALSKDWDAYVKVRRFMMVVGATLTGLHLLIAFTPLYDLIVRNLIGVPEAIIEPGRIGLMIMLPWSWGIGYRRVQQGVMIRFGHSGAVGVGTFVRLAANGLVLLAGYFIQSIPGIVVASSAIIVGVVMEAIYAGWRVRPILRDQVRLVPRTEPLSLREFFSFYIPLALTSLIALLVQPIGSATMSRLPQALDSLAAWPVVSGLLFMLRSGGIAYKEAVVALLKDEASAKVLQRFTTRLIIASSLILVLIAATPLSQLWFGELMALPPNLVTLARRALLISPFFPAMAALNSWYQGRIMYQRRTRYITEAVVLYTLAIAAGMGAGIALNRTSGLYVAVIVFQCAWAMQIGWLWWRNRTG